MKVIKPNRVIRSYTQTINSIPEKVFPLLCPVREEDWVRGWDPELVVTASGFAEKDCAFITYQDDERSYWIISYYDPENYEIEMYKITPRITIGKLNIKLYRDELNGTKAKITYSYTSLGKKGDDFVNNYSEEHYLKFMKSWEKEINHFLLTGKKISE